MSFWALRSTTKREASTELDSNSGTVCHGYGPRWHGRSELYLVFSRLLRLIYRCDLDQSERSYRVRVINQAEPALVHASSVSTYVSSSKRAGRRVDLPRAEVDSVDSAQL